MACPLGPPHPQVGTGGRTLAACTSAGIAAIIGTTGLRDEAGCTPTATRSGRAPPRPTTLSSRQPIVIVLLEHNRFRVLTGQPERQLQTAHGKPLFAL